jgi:hypothetical protein
MSRSDARLAPQGAGLLAAVCLARAAAGVELAGGVTSVVLVADGSAVRDDATLSVDLNVVRTTERGEWLVYLEGNSSLDDDRASTVIAESNADAGTALDADRRGRIQLSELHYRLELGEHALTVGLLDPSSYLDRTRITNDENVQFLGASFVNNPTIEFPDYTLGAVYQRPAEGRRPQLNAVLAGSNGLADNPNVSYSQLLRVTEDDRGAFAAVGFGWPTEERLVRAGVWLNTRSHAQLTSSDGDHDNYGWYAAFGRSWRAHAMSLRIGAARERVTFGSGFAAVAYRYRFQEHAVGFGVARVQLSPAVDSPALDDTTHTELFGRWAIRSAAHLTLSAQRIRHSGFHSAPGDPRRAIVLAGLRFHFAF